VIDFVRLVEEYQNGWQGWMHRDGRHYSLDGEAHHISWAKKHILNPEEVKDTPNKFTSDHIYSAAFHKGWIRTAGLVSTIFVNGFTMTDKQRAELKNMGVEHNARVEWEPYDPVSFSPISKMVRILYEPDSF